MHFDTALKSLPPAWDSPGGPDLSPLDRLVDSGAWGGPLVVSMPRTGSTLLGTLFLLLQDPPGSGDDTFRRYIHEPIAPVFWEGRPLESVRDFVESPLGPEDIVQESAYQFSSPEIASWFLRRARQPVAFTIRRPRRSWPSRWRIMLRQRLASAASDTDSERIRQALDRDDFSDLGDLLRAVRPPDNGWLAFLDLIRVCRDEGIDHVLVDNRLFRSDPKAVLGELCSRWGHEFDPALTEWTDLSAVRDRVVMSSLATGEEYPWYYRGTLESRGGIIRTQDDPLPFDRFPPELRGEIEGGFSIDDAARWYDALLTEVEVAGG